MDVLLRGGVLLVRRQDRISRRLRHTLAVIDHADEQGWSIATTDGELDTATAAGRTSTRGRAGRSRHVPIAQGDVDRPAPYELGSDRLALAAPEAGAGLFG